MAQVNDLSRSLTAFDPISTLVVVVEMSKASWLVSGAVPGVERQPLKKLAPDAPALLRLIERWRSEAVRAGRPISRIALAYEAGRDGFWLARWLIARGIEAHVIHSASVAVSRERKRAKTDRLDAAMLMRVFLGWLRGERGHCGMVAIPTMEEELRKYIGPKLSLQGNLDPAILFGPAEKIRSATQELANSLGGRGHILNLGHGILQHTPVEHAQLFIETGQQIEFAQTPPVAISAEARL